jgi:hypothetical protein
MSEAKMSHIIVEEEALIQAEAADIYRILADYRDGHPKILPKEYFTELVVEQGGIGEGTVFRVGVRAMGQVRSFHMTVREPEPGRQLTESDQDTDTVTTFQLTPQEGSQTTRVKIKTEWGSAPGLAGLIERWFTPGMMKRIYRKELQLLDDYALKSRPSMQ